MISIMKAFRPADGAIEAYATERSQAIVRVVLVSVGVTYMTYGIFTHQVPEQYRWVIGLLCATITVASVLILAAVVRWKRMSHTRRIFGMAHDYIAITIAMTFGGETLMPLYSLLLWVTTGNGFRYGPRYHLAAAILALMTLVIVTAFNAYWRQHPYMTMTLILTTILVPAYAHGLLTRVHRARDAALEANLAKSRFLAQASHDLRQPIHAISLFTACLRDTGLSTEQRQMVANIDKSLNSVAGLFRSLLDLSTLDSGRVTVRPEPVPIGKILNELVRQNVDAAQWAGVTFKMVMNTKYVLADPGLLATILQNIVSNALKYAPGKPVLVGCRRKGTMLSIEICDRGDGIADHHLPRLFEEFYQVRSPGDRDVEGVGLGLSIVDRLARLMGLSVKIHSVVGKGTRVVIAGLQIVDPPKQTAPARRSAQPTALNGLRVLLVEDDQIVLEATASLLTKWGCIVRQERTIPPKGPVECDLIITDFDLGEKVTGMDCIRDIRARAGHTLPAIIMTGHNPDRVREHVDESGISILSKPVRPAELRSIVVAQRFKALRAAKKNQAVPARSLVQDEELG